MRLEHEIFQGPLAANVELDPTVQWEEEYDDRGTWLVHEGEYPAVDVGVVSDGFGFEDSPDCERISGGMNSKGPEAVAIGRQANMLQWGFYGAPDRMTESAKKVFLNAIVYMQRFDGRQPLVKKASRGRRSMLSTIGFIHKLPSIVEEQREQFEDYLRGQFPAELIEEHGLDAAALTAWFEEKEEYFYATQGWSLGVDHELEALGISNREPAFLDMLVARLGEDPEDDLAWRLAQRYLGEEIGLTGARALAWVRENRPFLFFTDSGGYRWMVDTDARDAARAVEAAAGK